MPRPDARRRTELSDPRRTLRRAEACLARPRLLPRVMPAPMRSFATVPDAVALTPSKSRHSEGAVHRSRVHTDARGA